MGTIVRSGDGRFFELDEKTLKKYQVKAEKVPPGKRIPDLGAQAGGAVRIIIQVPPGSTVGGASEVGGRMQWPPHGEELSHGGHICPPTCGVRG